jgi:protoheme IX farnesyltransferase
MKRARIYYNLTKPGIVYGNAIHICAGVLFAAAMYPLHLNSFLGVLFGTSLVIASACVMNNYFDRNIDARMNRTKKRATVTGAISFTEIVIFAAVLLLGGLGLLAALTNLLVVGLGVTAYVFYVLIYTYSKRITVHSTLIGSVPGALPAVAGYAAFSDSLDTGALLLFFLIVCWQMPHFYAISLYRRRDYEAAKLPVLGVIAPVRTVKATMATFLISYIVTILLMNGTGVTGMGATLILLTGAGYWVYAFVRKSISTERWARRFFGASLVVSLLLPLAAALNLVLP